MKITNQEKSFTGLVQIERKNNHRKYLYNQRPYFVGKRFFDLFLATIVFCLFLCWLIPLISILIKLTSKGPVFFRQKRIGYMGKSFYCLKFRTMKVNKDADFQAAVENDCRITRIGHFLRRSNLDEVPQFLNVFMGHMSIVGPRPHMLSDCAKFSKVIEAYKFRNLMKPGITGLAQVKGFRGPAETFDQIFHRYQYDAFYVRNASFWLDVRIIRQTAAQTIFYILGKIVGREHLHEEFRKMKVYRKVTFSFKQLISRV
ncbi:MAG: sugar transferase [Chitinophagaceae bacterium]